MSARGGTLGRDARCLLWVTGVLLPKAIKERSGFALICAVLCVILAFIAWFLLGAKVRRESSERRS